MIYNYIIYILYRRDITRTSVFWKQIQNRGGFLQSNLGGPLSMVLFQSSCFLNTFISETIYFPFSLILIRHFRKSLVISRQCTFSFPTPSIRSFSESDTTYENLQRRSSSLLRPRDLSLLVVCYTWVSNGSRRTLVWNPFLRRYPWFLQCRP